MILEQSLCYLWLGKIGNKCIGASGESVCSELIMWTEDATVKQNKCFSVHFLPTYSGFLQCFFNRIALGSG